MELTQLRYFYTAAECKHITKAAESLHIAQPALTQSIRRLENELGVKLFERRGRSVALSECGVYLYKQLGGILRTLDNIPDELERIADVEKKTIKVNIIAASLLVTELIIEYKRLNPEIKFQLHQSTDNEHCDCTVSTVFPGHMPAVGKDMPCSLFHEDILLAVPADSDYAEMKAVNLSDAKDEGFISLSGSKPFHSICDSLCHSVGFSPNVIFESDSPSTVRDLIGSGMGIGFWPAYTWGSINTDNVTLLPIEYPVCKRELIVVCNNSSSESALDFYDFLCGRINQITEKRK